jgi:hypothetical protein
MRSSEVGTANKLADLGSRHGPSDVWRCDCDTEHNFGLYAAAHWDEELSHKCKCGVERTFEHGEVTSHSSQ